MREIRAYGDGALKNRGAKYVAVVRVDDFLEEGRVCSLETEAQPVAKIINQNVIHSFMPHIQGIKGAS
jgi:hypothetical protein